MPIMGIKRTTINGKNSYKAIALSPKKQYVKRIGKVKLTPPEKKSISSIEVVVDVTTRIIKDNKIDDITIPSIKAKTKTKKNKK